METKARINPKFYEQGSVVDMEDSHRSETKDHRVASPAGHLHYRDRGK